MASSLGIPVSLDDYGGLEDTLIRITERIRDQEQKRRMIAEVLKRLRQRINLSELEGEKDSEIAENKLSIKVEKTPISDSRVMGVDGGVLSRRLHGLDLVLVRAVAAIFDHKDGELSNAEYYPSEMPTPRLMSIDEPLDSRELELLIGMQRQLTELQLAIEALKAYEVDAALLDGSVVPQYVDRFPHTPKVLKLYQKLIKTFIELYEVCARRKIPLAGAVKDSRSARFIDIFQRKVLPILIDDDQFSSSDILTMRGNKGVLSNSRDTIFLDHLLDVGERSFTFHYAKPPAKVLGDLGKWATRIYAFYIKSVPYDRPLRVEFIDGTNSTPQVADRVASLIHALSAHHDACALPSVLLEADACARLAEEELTIIKDNIADRLEPSTLLDLRRQRRPF